MAHQGAATNRIFEASWPVCFTRQAKASASAGSESSPLLVVLIICIVYLLLGCFIDSIGIMLLTAPIMIPILKEVGIDLIWFGIIVVKLLEIGLVSPPVGLNVFVIKSTLGNAMSLTTIFRGAFWFIGTDMVTLGLLIAFPFISLYLPSLMG